MPQLSRSALFEVLGIDEIHHRTVNDNELTDPPSFSEALRFHMDRHCDTVVVMHRVAIKAGARIDVDSIRLWARGTQTPRLRSSLKVLVVFAKRYGLPDRYFSDKLRLLPASARALIILDQAPPSRNIYVWHLPDDFDARSIPEQKEIVDWIRANIISNPTEYSRYLQRVKIQPFSVRFPAIMGSRLGKQKPATRSWDETRADYFEEKAKHNSIQFDAPKQLADEMMAFTEFRTQPQAAGVGGLFKWGPITTNARMHLYGSLFGALCASPDSLTKGLDLSKEKLTFGLLAFSVVWDWYLNWRLQRRGFFTSAEKGIMSEAALLHHQHAGWLRLHPELLERVFPIAGLLTSEMIAEAKNNWSAACDKTLYFAISRKRDIGQLASVHRDSVDAILPALEAENALKEYRKIPEEIVRRMPDENILPVETAQAVRAFLMLRIGLHSGLRQRNLRELLLSWPGIPPVSESALKAKRCGVIRRNNESNCWELYIPANAFKNSRSSFFRGKPYWLVLPDTGQLYQFIDAYVQRHRSIILGKLSDPGTFFVRSARNHNSDGRYDQHGYYQAFRRAIQRYGIYNPYTQRGAIAGLLPHGPHCVRDILATYVLRKTGSFTQASYAIQGARTTLARHYARFSPKEKVAQVSKILDEAWSDGETEIATNGVDVSAII